MNSPNTINSDYVLNDRRIVLKAGLPLNESGFSRIRSYPEHRCDIIAEGISLEYGQRRYDFNNQQRADFARHIKKNSCTFQYTFSGEGRFQTLPHGRIVRMTPGMAFLAPVPSPTRYWLPPGGAWEFGFLLISGDMAHSLVTQLVRLHGYLWQLPVTHPAIDLLKHLHRRVLDRQIPDEFEVATLAHRFLMELFRTHRKPRPDVLPAIGRVIQLVDQDYHDPDLSIERMAREAGLSRHHFSRLFRRETGSSPHAYLQYFRLQRALNRVTNSAVPIKQIALESGYRDYAYFCKEFKRLTHQTPLSARRIGDKFNLSAIHTE
jgi:AraC-like DNA-binding protein